MAKHQKPTRDLHHLKDMTIDQSGTQSPRNIEGLASRMQKAFVMAQGQFKAKNYRDASATLTVSLREYDHNSKQHDNKDEGLNSLHAKMVALQDKTIYMSNAELREIREGSKKLRATPKDTPEADLEGANAVFHEIKKGKTLNATRKDTPEVNQKGQNIRTTNRLQGGEYNLKESLEKREQQRMDKERAIVRNESPNVKKMNEVVTHFCKELESMLSTIHRKDPNYQTMKGKNDLIDLLVTNLKAYSQGFTSGAIKYAEFKASCNEAIADTKTRLAGLGAEFTREPKTALEHISEVLRKMFHQLDRLVTHVTGSKQTMAESRTPMAQTIVGRDHFFNKPETQLGEVMRKGATELNKPDDAKSTPRPSGK